MVTALMMTQGLSVGTFTSPNLHRVSERLAHNGEPIDARTAADWGLVNRVVSPAELSATTRALAARIAGAASFVVGLGKAAFYAQIDLDQPKAYAYAKEVMSMNALSEDAQEGMGAFVGKRAPVWRT